MIEIYRVTKRKGMRYIRGKVTLPAKEVSNEKHPLHIRIYRVLDLAGNISFNPTMEILSVESVGPDSFEFKVKIQTESDWDKFELGLVREGITWLARKWINM